MTRPNAKKVVSPADRDLMEQHGAAVVECSWVRVKEVPWSRIGGKCERLRTLGHGLQEEYLRLTYP